MKKITALILASAFLFIVCACGPSAVLQSPDKEDAASKLEAAKSISDQEARDSGVYLEDKRVSFTAAGDNIIYTSTWTDARNHAAKSGSGAEYDFKPIYKNIADLIKNADIAYINQETLMTGGANSAYPYFNSPRQLGRDLVELGFDVVSIANNHMLDQRDAGLVSTIDFWNTLDVTLVGGYKSEADYNDIRVIEKNGIKIAMLSYTEHTNGVKKQGDTVVVPYFDEETIKRQTKAARELADIVIVAMHWGDEYVQKPNAIQEKYAALLAECEVDVILGSHSHSLQPIVELERPSGAKTLCIYSLGNFLHAMDRAVNMVGGMLSFDIVKPEVGATRVENVILTPVVCHFDKTWFNAYMYELKDYTEELAAKHYVSMTLSQMRAFVTGAIDAKYLPDYLK